MRFVAFGVSSESVILWDRETPEIWSRPRRLSLGSDDDLGTYHVVH